MKGCHPMNFHAGAVKWTTPEISSKVKQSLKIFQQNQEAFQDNYINFLEIA